MKSLSVVGSVGRAERRVISVQPRRLGASERAEALCDPGTFTESERLRRARSGRQRDGDGVLTGWGLVQGRPVAVISHDFSHAGGSIGAAFAAKVVRAQRLAIERRIPLVFLNDSGGARIQEGIEALNGCGEIMALNVEAQRVVPQLSLIMGPCAGAAAYSPALTDWTLMVRDRSQMFLTGPEVVRAATGESVTPEELGGASLHTKESGVAHLECADEAAALTAARRLLSYLPSAAGAEQPRRAPATPPPARMSALSSIGPASSRQVYDMRRIVAGIVDAGIFFELMPGLAPNLLTGFARLEGMPIGMVASQPARRGGTLDSTSSKKGARFVSFCGRFGIPIVTLVDVPGFMPGANEERKAVITHGAELLAAYVEARSPKLTVIVRKAYGGAYIAMGSRSLGAAFCWAWPSAEIAVMGPEAAVGLVHKRDLAAAEDPVELRARFAAEYREQITMPSVAAGLGLVDDIIAPEETRRHLVNALRLLSH